MSSFTPAGPVRPPVLLVIFNRPETTRLVFEAIRKAKPPKLYVAADGPRKNIKSDIENCAGARKIIEHVDWDCKVETLFRDENLNCGLGPSSALHGSLSTKKKGLFWKTIACLLKVFSGFAKRCWSAIDT